MSAIGIVREVCSRMNLPWPTKLVGATDPADRQWASLLLVSLEDIRRRAYWPQLKKSYTFTTVASQDTYALPSGFYAMLPHTEYDETRKRHFYAISDEEAAYKLYGAGLTSGDYTYRIFGDDYNPYSTGGQFQLIPTPSSEDTITFEYICNELFIPPLWTPSTAVTITTSYCFVNGIKYQCTQSGTTSTTAPTHTTGEATDGTAKWTVVSLTGSSLTADDFNSVFDEETARLALRARYLEENGGTFEEAKKEFEARLNMIIARFLPNRIGAFGGKRFFSPTYFVPDGSWSL